jgi:surfactin synthase thioesterase subunit
MFDIPLGDVKLFTANGPMQNYLRDDEHQLRKASAAFMFTSRRIDLAIRKAAVASLDIPVSVILSDEDKIIDNASTQQWLRRVCNGGLDVQMLTGAHTLEFERCPADFLRAVGSACGAEKAEKS